MKLAYRAFDKSGHEVSAVMTAADVGEARERLCQQDLFVAEVRPVDDSAAAGASGWRLPQGRVRKLRDVTMFTRQLYALMRSGTPLAQGLGALERQSKDLRWKEVIQDLGKRIERGSSLSEALKAHPDLFDTIYTSMVAAGESSGKLTELLDRIATLTRKRVHVLSTVRAAMAYPILLALVATGVMSAMLLFVVPRFGELFRSIGVPLPPTTAALIAIGDFLQTYWWIALAGLVGLTIVTWLYVKSSPGRRMVHTLVLRAPAFGKITRSFATARITRILGLLMDSHLPIQEILRLTGSTASNVHYQALLAKAEQAVDRGEPISTAFQDSTLIAPTVCETIRSGEQSGQVSSLLLELSDFLDEENETTLKSLTSIIEPVLLVVMGAMVGLVAMSIFLPLFDVTSMAGGGGH